MEDGLVAPFSGVTVLWLAALIYAVAPTAEAAGGALAPGGGRRSRSGRSIDLETGEPERRGDRPSPSPSRSPHGDDRLGRG